MKLSSCTVANGSEPEAVNQPDNETTTEGFDPMLVGDEGDANGSSNCSLVRERVRTFEQAYAETQKARRIVEEIRARKDTKRPRRSQSEDQALGTPTGGSGGNLLDTWGTISPPSTPIRRTNAKEARSAEGDPRLPGVPDEETRSPTISAPPPSPFSPPPQLPLPPPVLQSEQPPGPSPAHRSGQYFPRGSPKSATSALKAFSPRSPGESSSWACHTDAGTPRSLRGDVAGVLSRTNSGHSLASTFASASTTTTRSAYTSTMSRFHSTAAAARRKSTRLQINPLYETSMEKAPSARAGGANTLRNLQMPKNDENVPLHRRTLTSESVESGDDTARSVHSVPWLGQITRREASILYHAVSPRPESPSCGGPQGTPGETNGATEGTSEQPFPHERTPSMRDLVEGCDQTQSPAAAGAFSGGAEDESPAGPQQASSVGPDPDEEDGWVVMGQESSPARLPAAIVPPVGPPGGPLVPQANENITGAVATLRRSYELAKAERMWEHRGLKSAKKVVPMLDVGQKRVLKAAAAYEALAQPSPHPAQPTTPSLPPTVRGLPASQTVSGNHSHAGVSSSGNEGQDSCASSGRDSRGSSGIEVLSSSPQEVSSLFGDSRWHRGTSSRPAGGSGSPPRVPEVEGTDESARCLEGAASMASDPPAGLRVSTLRERFFKWEWGNNASRPSSKRSGNSDGVSKTVAVGSKGVKAIITELEQDQVLHTRDSAQNGHYHHHYHQHHHYILDSAYSARSPKMDSRPPLPRPDAHAAVPASSEGFAEHLEPDLGQEWVPTERKGPEHAKGAPAVGPVGEGTAWVPMRGPHTGDAAPRSESDVRRPSSELYRTPLNEEDEEDDECGCRTGMEEDGEGPLSRASKHIRETALAENAWRTTTRLAAEALAQDGAPAAEAPQEDPAHRASSLQLVVAALKRDAARLRAALAGEDTSPPSPASPRRGGAGLEAWAPRGGATAGTPPPAALEGRPELGRLSVAEAREEGERAVEALRLVLDAARRRSYDAAAATQESTAVFCSTNVTPGGFSLRHQRRSLLNSSACGKMAVQGGKRGGGSRGTDAVNHQEAPLKSSRAVEYTTTYQAVVSCTAVGPSATEEGASQGGLRLRTALAQAAEAHPSLGGEFLSPGEVPTGVLGNLARASPDLPERASYMARAGAERWRASANAIAQSCDDVRKESLPLALAAEPRELAVIEEVHMSIRKESSGTEPYYDAHELLFTGSLAGSKTTTDSEEEAEAVAYLFDIEGLQQRPERSRQKRSGRGFPHGRAHPAILHPSAKQKAGKSNAAAVHVATAVPPHEICPANTPEGKPVPPALQSPLPLHLIPVAPLSAPGSSKRGIRAVVRARRDPHAARVRLCNYVNACIRLYDYLIAFVWPAVR
eukprot:jgi/Botrbrau1/12629/Bobra.0169s0154.1